MALRVMLKLDEDQVLDGNWFEDLASWDLSGVAGASRHARCVAMIAMVAARYPRAQVEGALAWPTIADLGQWMQIPILYGGGHLAFEGETMRLLTVAVAAGWLVMFNDGTGS